MELPPTDFENAMPLGLSYRHKLQV
jgi:hypothetical protein